MKISHLMGTGLLVVSAWAQAQSTPIEQWQIIEGKGLTDNYVYLGMSRAEARTRTANGNCNGKVSQCSFRAQDRADAPVLTLYFNEKGKVQEIQILQDTSGIFWRTTAGAVDTMYPAEVQALYPGSTIAQVDYSTVMVVAARQGYRYNFKQVCNSDDQCDTTVYHTVIKRQKTE